MMPIVVTAEPVEITAPTVSPNVNTSNHSNDNWMDDMESDNALMQSKKVVSLPNPPITILSKIENIKEEKDIPLPNNDGSVIRYAYIMNQSKVNKLSYTELFNQIFIQKKNYAYEWLDAGVVPYFDYDAKNLQSMEDVNKMTTHFWMTLMQNVIKVFPNLKGVNQDIFVMLSSGPTNIQKNGPFKFSAHVVIRGHGYYENVVALRESGLIQKMDEVMTPFKCDSGVYDMEKFGQKMRILGCYKKGKFHQGVQHVPEDDAHRILQLVQCQNLTAELFKQTLIQVIAGETLIPTIKKPQPEKLVFLPPPQMIENTPVSDVLSELEEEKLNHPEDFPNEVKQESKNFIEYTGQSDDECINLMTDLFEALHPSSSRPKSTVKNGFTVIEFSKFSNDDVCYICKRAHEKNRNIMTYHPDAHVGYYKCHSAIDDGHPEAKILVLGKRNNNVPQAVAQQFIKDEKYCWIDFYNEFTKTEFPSKYELEKRMIQKLPKVFAKVLCGTGFYVKKDNLKDKMYSNISNIGTILDFDVYFVETTQEKNGIRTEKKKIKFSKLYDEIIREIPVFSEVVCKPNADELELNEFNIWTGFRAKVLESFDENKIAPVLDLLKKVWCDDEEEIFQYLLDWLSFLVCKPEKTPDVAIAIFGKEGTGKDTFIEFFSEWVLGFDIVFNATGIEKITQKHCAGLSGKKLAVINEMAAAQDEFRSNFDKMKQLITGRKVQFEPKGKEIFEVDNILGYILCSNHPESLVLSTVDRRYLCLSAGMCYFQNKKFFTELREKIMNVDVGNHFYTFLKKRNITNKAMICSPPMTQMKKEIQELCKSNVEKFADYVKSVVMPFGVDQNGNNWDGKTFNNNQTTFSNTMGKTELYKIYEQWFAESGFAVRLKKNRDALGDHFARVVKKTNTGNRFTLHLDSWY